MLRRHVKKVHQYTGPDDNKGIEALDVYDDITENSLLLVELNILYLSQQSCLKKNKHVCICAVNGIQFTTFYSRM